MTNQDFEIKDCILYLFLNYLIEHSTQEQKKELEFITKQTNQDNIVEKLIILFDLVYIDSQLELLPDLSKIMSNMAIKNNGNDTPIHTGITEQNNNIKIPVSAFKWGG